MGPEPRQSKRQRHMRGRTGREQMAGRRDQQDESGDEARSVHDRRCSGPVPGGHRDWCQSQEQRHARESDLHRHGTAALSRTPRPPLSLAAFSPMSSMPAVSSAATSFISEVDVAADDAVARLHALDGRQRQRCEFRKSALVDAKQCTSRPKLRGRYHAKDINYDIPNPNCHCYRMNRGAFKPGATQIHEIKTGPEPRHLARQKGQRLHSRSASSGAVYLSLRRRRRRDK